MTEQPQRKRALLQGAITVARRTSHAIVRILLKTAAKATKATKEKARRARIRARHNSGDRANNGEWLDTTHGTACLEARAMHQSAQAKAETLFKLSARHHGSNSSAQMASCSDASRRPSRT